MTCCHHSYFRLQSAYLHSIRRSLLVICLKTLLMPPASMDPLINKPNIPIRTVLIWNISVTTTARKPPCNTDITERKQTHNCTVLTTCDWVIACWPVLCCCCCCVLLSSLYETKNTFEQTRTHIYVHHHRLMHARRHTQYTRTYVFTNITRKMAHLQSNSINYVCFIRI